MNASDRVLAQRYCQALCQEAEKSGSLGEAYESLSSLHRSLEEFSAFFLHPLIPLPDKFIKLGSAQGSKSSPLVFNFLKLLIQRKRFYLLTAILSCFEEVLDQKMSVLKARVSTALPLPPAEEQALKERLSAALGKNVVLDTCEDPRMIGGILVRAGDWVLDGSFANALERMRGMLFKGA